MMGTCKGKGTGDTKFISCFVRYYSVSRTGSNTLFWASFVDVWGQFDIFHSKQDGTYRSIDDSTVQEIDYRTIPSPSFYIYIFWGRDITKANFFFLFVICGWGQGTGKFVLPLRSIKSSDGTGGQAGTFRWTSPKGHLVCPE